MRFLCPVSCPCRLPKGTLLTANQWLDIERYHFDAKGEPIKSETPSAAQGDVHWLDWHAAEPKDVEDL